MPFNWYIDSVEEWAYVHPDLMESDLVAARCKTRQECGVGTAALKVSVGQQLTALTH